MILQKLGGDYQLVIDRPNEIGQISELAESHWMATSAPRDSFTCDTNFLEYMDGDGDARIMSNDVKTAQQWLFKMTNRYENMGTDNTTLKLCEIDDTHEDGLTLIKAAKRILSNLGCGDADEITLAQVRNRKQIGSKGGQNGDGVISADAVDDSELKTFVEDIIRTVGGVSDVSDKIGVDEQFLARFMEECRIYLSWIDQKNVSNEQNSTELMILGCDTDEAYAIFKKIENKIEAFFFYSWLNRHHKYAQTAEKSTFGNLAKADATSSSARESNFSPLSVSFEDESLVFDNRINPDHRESAFQFLDRVLRRIIPVKGIHSMSLDNWELIKQNFRPYEQWIHEKPETKCESLGVDTLRRYVEGDYGNKLGSLIQKDLEVANELKYIDDVEKLILYRQWLFEFTNNYVSLASLYNPGKPSLIQVGTLIIDGRRFELTMKVIDSAYHKKVVEQSNICVMYLTISRSDNDGLQSMDVASAVTSGTMSRLFVGKLGVFYTPDGREWNAKVTDFVANPVSVMEAVKRPFKQVGEFMGKQAERFSKSRYQEIEVGLGESIKSAEKNISSSPTKEDPNKISGHLRELMLSGSLALAALGGSFAYITKTLQEISFLKTLSVVGGLLVIVFVPIVVIALIKLRSRNLSVFLEACGWAVNGQMRLSYEMGLIFTHEPKIPRNSRQKRIDSAKALLKQLRINAHPRMKWLLSLFILSIVITVVGLLAFKLFFYF